MLGYVIAGLLESGLRTAIAVRFADEINLMCDLSEVATLERILGLLSSLCPMTNNIIRSHLQYAQRLKHEECLTSRARLGWHNLQDGRIQLLTEGVEADVVEVERWLVTYQLRLQAREKSDGREDWALLVPFATSFSNFLMRFTQCRESSVCEALSTASQDLAILLHLYQGVEQGRLVLYYEHVVVGGSDGASPLDLR